MFGHHWELFGNAYIGCIVLAVCTAYLGVYIVLRRIIFFGMGLIQVAALGVAIAFLLGQNVFLWSAITTLSSIILFSMLQNTQLVTKENTIGIVYIGAGAYSLILLKQSAMGTEELQNFFYGHLLLMSNEFLMIMVSVLVLVFIFHIIFFRRFLFVAFDSEMSQTLGVNSKLWDMLFYASLALVVAVSTKAAGSLLMFNYFILPATTAVISSQKIKDTFLYAIFYSILATIIGLYLQHIWGFPPAQTIASVSVFILVIVAIWRYQKSLALIVFLLIVIGTCFVPSYDRIKEEQHNTNISLVRNYHVAAEIIVTTTDKEYFFVPNEEVVIKLNIQNTTSNNIIFYASLDFGFDIVTIEVQSEALKNNTLEVTIPIEVTEFLSEQNTILLSFWEDKVAIIPSSHQIETTNIVLRQK